VAQPAKQHVVAPEEGSTSGQKGESSTQYNLDVYTLASRKLDSPKANSFKEKVL
jgi:hypothetical protein